MRFVLSIRPSSRLKSLTLFVKAQTRRLFKFGKNASNLSKYFSKSSGHRQLLVKMSVSNCSIRSPATSFDSLSITQSKSMEAYDGILIWSSLRDGRCRSEAKDPVQPVSLSWIDAASKACILPNGIPPR